MAAYANIIQSPIIKTTPIKQSRQILLPAIIRKLSSKASPLLSSPRKPKLPKIIHQTIVINKTINVHPHPGKSVKIVGEIHHGKQQKIQHPVKQQKPLSQRYGYGYGSHLDRLNGNPSKTKNQGNPSGIAHGLNSGFSPHYNTGLHPKNPHVFNAGHSGQHNNGQPSNNVHDFNAGHITNHQNGPLSNKPHGLDAGHSGNQNTGLPFNTLHGFNSGYNGNQNTGLPFNSPHDITAGQNGIQNNALPFNSPYVFEPGYSGNPNNALPLNNPQGFDATAQGSTGGYSLGHGQGQVHGPAPLSDLRHLPASALSLVFDAIHLGRQAERYSNGHNHGIGLGSHPGFDVILLNGQGGKHKAYGGAPVSKQSQRQASEIPLSIQHGINHINNDLGNNHISANGLDTIIRDWLTGNQKTGLSSSQGGKHKAHGGVPLSSQSHEQSSKLPHNNQTKALEQHSGNHVNHNNLADNPNVAHGVDAILRDWLTGNQKSGLSTGLPSGLDTLLLDSLANNQQGHGEAPASETLADQVLAAEVINNLLNTVPNTGHGLSGQIGANVKNLFNNLKSGLNHKTLNTNAPYSVETLTKTSKGQPVDQQTNGTITKVAPTTRNHGNKGLHHGNKGLHHGNKGLHHGSKSLNHNSNNTHVFDSVNDNSYPTNPQQHNGTMPTILRMLDNVVTNIQRNIQNPASNSLNSKNINQNNPLINHILIHGAKPVLISSISGGYINNITNPFNFGNGALTEEQIEMSEA